jgi:mono/diheme cytochrome c family protein
MRLIFGAAVLVMMAACSQSAVQREPTQAELVARGQYLVTGIGGCNDCHTPLTPQGPDLAHSLQGATLAIRLTTEFEGHVPWAAAAPQIAGGPASYSDEQFTHFLMTGEKPNGSHARPPMPQFRLNADDARAVVAYIKTVPRSQ